jgi:16S rRNA G966 N2-methylase RsmD
VFLDPPFGQGLIQKSCDLLKKTNCLKPQSLIYIEAEPELELPAYLTIKKQGKAGQVKYLLASLS